MVPRCVLSAAAAIAAFRVSPSTPAKHLSQIRKRKKGTRDDTFSEILQASAASDHEHRAWRMNVADSLEKEKVERRKAQQEKERERHQDIKEPLWKRTHMLQTLVDLQVQQS
ncbi:hypothetical protein KIL84_008269 [Mauremys mutica]|uniref:Uncharacterized protein n=1 Tax=Mauremys mutica TaxID=74926 RepID=A0A9D4B0A5_9SAUR|nr:hypothetical protein KIL84_008269 [Mauremys mutica]